MTVLYSFLFFFTDNRETESVESCMIADTDVTLVNNIYLSGGLNNFVCFIFSAGGHS